MMNKIFLPLIFLFLISLSEFISAQNYNFLGEIGKFNSAVSISASRTGNFFISDREDNKIYKIDTLGNVIYSYGGYGWDERGFDDPADVFSASLKVFVSDKNNHSIKIFDKDLNFLNRISGESQNDESARFRYPVCCRVSSQGDIYILDSEEGRILKFDYLYNFKSFIGGFDAGSFQLEKPVNFDIDAQSNIYVIDGQKLIIFDKFGNGLFDLNYGISFNKIKTSGNFIILSDQENIYLLNISDKSSAPKKIMLNNTDFIPVIRDFTFLRKKLYVLTPEEILIYSPGK